MSFLIKKSVRFVDDELKSIPELDYKSLQDKILKDENTTTLDLRTKVKRPKNENVTIVPGEVVQYENGQHDWGAYPQDGAFVMDGGPQWNGVC